MTVRATTKKQRTLDLELFGQSTTIGTEEASRWELCMHPSEPCLTTFLEQEESRCRRSKRERFSNITAI